MNEKSENLESLFSEKLTEKAVNSENTLFFRDQYSSMLVIEYFRKILSSRNSSSQSFLTDASYNIEGLE